MEHGGGGYGGGGHSYPPPTQQQQQQFAPPPPPPPPSLHGAQPFPPGPAPVGAQPFFAPPLQFSYPSLPYPFVPPPSVQPPSHPPLGFFNPWEPPPPIVPPPPDAELQKRIEKLVEYAAKNGPEFEKMLKEKQKDNPAYAFLFGAEGHNYYRYKLWITVNPHLGGFSGPPMIPLTPALPPLNPALNPALASLNPPLPSLNPQLNAPPLNTSLNTPLHSVPVPPTAVFTPFYDQQQLHLHHQQPPQPQPYFEPVPHETYEETGSKPFKGLSGPLPTDVAAELQDVLENLTGTKESIKGAKNWFMQRSPFAPALAEALRERVLALHDDIRQLHVIYLANDILFDSLQRRINLKELDNEALAFQRVLGPMLAAIYHNPQNKEANQTRLRKILQFWGSKEVYGKEIISALESEMTAGPPAGYQISVSPPTQQTENSSLLSPSNIAAAPLPPETAMGNNDSTTLSPEPSQIHSPSEQEQRASLASLAATAQYGPTTGLTPSANQQFTANSVPAVYPTLNPQFLSSLSAATQSTLGQLPSTRVTDHAPYPLFPPGLIPGMVRKMQIGSGVPYSPLSPLDIPAVIPPSTASESYVLDRVAKFFKEIGEVDPLEGQFKGSGRLVDDDDEREDEERGRKGGACIPPPGNLNVDTETNTLPDGSMEHKPGAISTGRLGLGAVADPNEITQYDDVYTSYRKQRSTNYHTSMSARAAAR